MHADCNLQYADARRLHGATGVNSYRISGLSVRSDIALPGLLPGPPSGAADVTIRQGAVPAELAAPQAWGRNWQSRDDVILFRARNVARFLVTAGRQIAFELENDTAPGDAAIFLIGTVFGFLLHQRRRIVLHASAVDVGGKAVLFCGASGAGKSTLAAALNREGFSLLSDDLCAVRIDDEKGPMVPPDGRQLKLWAGSIQQLELAPGKGRPVRKGLEKFYVAPGEVSVEPLPLGAIYILREVREGVQPGIQQPNAVDAAVLLRRNAYRPVLVRRLGQKVDYFHAATAIGNRAGIFHLTRALEFTALPMAIASLRAHWRQRRLLLDGKD